MTRLWEIPMLGLIITICAIHAGIFKRNRIIGPWFHAIWAAVYFIPAGIIAALCGSWWLGATFVIERAVFYGPTLNILRGKLFFYTGPNSLNHSWTDSVLASLGGLYPYLWWAGVAMFITVQFFI